jgi:anti-sigma regulatory factor (Ser/Thr protein kinase)
VTLTYAAVHPQEMLATVVSAGHLPLQVVSVSGEHREVPSEVGPPLGVHPSGAHWPETTSALPAKGVLAAFTDGLVETRHADISVGQQRVRDTLVARRADRAEAVADALLASRGRSGDDVALLVARFTAQQTSERRSTRRMPPTSASVFLARRSTRQLLGAWGVPSSVVEAGEMVVSELVTNAARQSEDPIDVVLSCAGRVLRVEVADTSHRMPVLPVEDVHPDATSGRGLMLVEALADRWGVQSEGLGKRVWAEIDLPG